MNKQKPALAAMLFMGACLAAATPAFASYFMYAPRPTEEEAPPPPKTREEGILVKEITIQKGDTLSAISRSFSGHASYFPQILLFNDIRNPDLIFEGNTLRVPVTKSEPEAKAKGKKRERVQEGKREKKRRKAGEVRVDRKPAERSAEEGRQSGREPREQSPEQRLYSKAVQAYRMGRCEEALPLFDAFLKRYPQALSVPDISLLRADCLLKLSEQ